MPSSVIAVNQWWHDGLSGKVAHNIRQRRSPGRGRKGTLEVWVTTCGLRWYGPNLPTHTDMQHPACLRCVGRLWGLTSSGLWRPIDGGTGDPKHPRANRPTRVKLPKV